jgi:hypothetical protein
MLVGRACLLLSLLDHATAINTLYVSVNGSDSASGTNPATSLSSCAAAVAKLAALLEGDTGPAKVQFGPGRFVLNGSTACGLVKWNGSATAMLTFAGDPGGGTLFDASSLLDATLLKPVKEPRITRLVNPAATAKLLAMPLANKPTTLEWDGRPLFSSVWPNPQVGTGVAYVRKVLDRGSYYYKGRSSWPQPHPHVCMGDNKSTIASPCGANISIAEQPAGDWEAEMAAGPGFGSVTVVGYLANDWEQLTLTVARVQQNTTNTTIQFNEYTPYGVCEAMEGGYKSLVNHCGGPAPGRFTVSGLLSEVDVPGEWWYDDNAHQLYIYPPDPDGGGTWTAAKLKSVRLGHWEGPGLMSIDSSSHVTLRDVTVSGVGGSTIVSIGGGDHNTVGGCTLRNSAGTAISLGGGHHNAVIGNDIYDVATHLETAGNGGDENLQSFGLTSNLVANNHMTQVYLTGKKWGPNIRGQGDRFSHNLLHDAPGQIITTGTPLLMFDHNEIFVSPRVQRVVVAPTSFVRTWYE